MILAFMIIRSNSKHIGSVNKITMNTQKSSTKNWIIIGVVIVVAAGAYFFFMGGSPTSSGTLQATGGDATGLVGTQVLSLLNQIRTLRIDSALFKDPAYLSLHDFSVTIPQQNVGRANPFAPIPGMPLVGAKK